MKRVREIITCLILVALCGCGAEVAEPPTHEPEVVTVTPEVAPEVTPAITSAIASKASEAEESEAVEAMRKVWDFEGGVLQEGATIELLEEARAKAVAIDNPETKTNLFIMAHAVQQSIEAKEEAKRKAEEERKRKEEERANARSMGSCRITFYCSCSSCCGKWGNATASGVAPTAGRTVANGSLPFGTRVIIEGHEYVVEDRGVGGDQFDIYVNSHSEALARGLYYTEVFVID